MTDHPVGPSTDKTIATARNDGYCDSIVFLETMKINEYINLIIVCFPFTFILVIVSKVDHVLAPVLSQQYQAYFSY
jgi:hypothetical protein